MIKAEDIKFRVERDPIRWAVLCEFIIALGYEADNSRASMLGNLSKRMKKAVKEGRINRLSKGCYQLDDTYIRKLLENRE